MDSKQSFRAQGLVDHGKDAYQKWKNVKRLKSNEPFKSRKGTDIVTYKGAVRSGNPGVYYMLGKLPTKNNRKNAK